MNPFGINLWNWVQGLDEACVPLVKKAAEMGFTAVEIPMTVPTHACLPALKREIERCNMRVSLCAAMVAGRDISNEQAEVRAATRAYIMECLQTAAFLGADVFAGPLYSGGAKRHSLPPRAKAAEWQRAVEGLRDMADYAAERGVALALEPLNRYRTSVVNTAGQALQMAEDIGCANVGIHFDTYQANMEEWDVCAALEEVLKAGKLGHFHACGNNRGAPGTGHLPWRQIFNLLKKYGYKGHITMETFCEGSMDPCWYPLAPTQNALARQGIAYLKQAMQQ
ncbi:MAG: sugar phosphate isomerase/epimerase family protein [Oscillospiraceae bacterium]